MERINRFTGKPMPETAAFGRLAGYKCDLCDTDAICDCLICGAPNCCPRCCDEATRELTQEPAMTDRTQAEPAPAGATLDVERLTRERAELLKALADAARQESSMARRMRAAVVEARRRLAKTRHSWNGPIHEADGILAEALTVDCPVRHDPDPAPAGDLVERMCRAFVVALADPGHADPDRWHGWSDAMTAAIAAIRRGDRLPGGLTAVPVEPDEAMVRAGWEYRLSTGLGADNARALAGLFRAMLAAAGGADG